MTILFDLDGTLFDTARDIHTAVNAVLRDINAPEISYSEMRNLVSFGTRKILAHALKVDLATDPEKAEYIKQQLVPKVLAYYQQTGFTQTVAYPGIAELLDQLEAASIKWGIVTNKIKPITEPLLKITGHYDRAACIVCADEVSNGKPAPDSLLRACELLQLAPTACVYIGDAATDIQAGKAAGMRTIAAAFGFVPDLSAVHSWQADHIVQTADQILPCLQNWGFIHA